MSDAESPDGVLSNPIFESVNNYDLLTIGNHELYLSDVAYLTASQFAKHYGKKYLTSNVQIFNNDTRQYEYIGQQYRYFTTPKGLRIMAMGFLYDFTGNSNASKVIKAVDAIKQPWFSAAVNYTEPIDLFILMGHNPLRASSGSTLTTVSDAHVPVPVPVPEAMLIGQSDIPSYPCFSTCYTYSSLRRTHSYSRLCSIRCWKHWH